jgi:hypothetical protein
LPQQRPQDVTRRGTCGPRPSGRRPSGFGLQHPCASAPAPPELRDSHGLVELDDGSEHLADQTGRWRVLNERLRTISSDQLDAPLREHRITDPLDHRRHRPPRGSPTPPPTRSGQPRRPAAIAYSWCTFRGPVGADRDSERRQREAIQGFARRAGYDHENQAASDTNAAAFERAIAG